MNDYSICLIELEKNINNYRKTILANNLKSAIEIVDQIDFWSKELYDYTESVYLDNKS